MVEIEEIESEDENGVRQRKKPQNKKIDLSLDQSESLTKEILRQGTGEPVGKGKRVSVHYVGTLTNGKEFDSSRKRGVPLQVVIGTNKVILGWDIGIASMKKGELAILTCAPDYAYGASGVGPIPPFATLKFEVELLDFDEADSGTSTFTIFAVILFVVFLLILAKLSL